MYVVEKLRNSRGNFRERRRAAAIHIFASLEMFGTIAKAMLPQLAEATTGKNSILLENAGNIMQWMVTGTGLFFLGKAVVKSKA
jgi:hypothetical protein